MTALPPVARFETSTGVTIYRLSCQAFPGLIAHTYLLLGAGPVTLVDTGSGYADSTPQLLRGLETVREEFGESVRQSDIRRIIITHGHLDHFGGLAQVQRPIQAEVGIHELDRWVLTAYEERLVVATKALRFFFQRAGVAPKQQAALMELYTVAKKHVRSVRVDFTIADGQQLDGLTFIHTPGHCPGQVCIQIGDVMLSADHVLPRTTPHQSPESITASTGLRHYLDALTKIGRVEGVRLALGGHEDPFGDFQARVAAIRVDHERKLERVLGVLRGGEPLSILGVTERMYPAVTGWNVLLALEEVGAHVEYLYESGALRVVNLDEVEKEENPTLEFAAR
ncbi:MAG: MBL fold metallo-hydrolase [Gemmatimonadota bacterium]